MPMLKVGATIRLSSPASAAWAMISGHSQSVPSRPVGPCCSFEPIGTTTVLDSDPEEAMRASISGQDDRWISMGGLPGTGVSGVYADPRRSVDGEGAEEAAGDVSRARAGTSARGGWGTPRMARRWPWPSVMPANISAACCRIGDRQHALPVLLGHPGGETAQGLARPGVVDGGGQLRRLGRHQGDAAERGAPLVIADLDDQGLGDGGQNRLRGRPRRAGGR